MKTAGVSLFVAFLGVVLRLLTGIIRCRRAPIEGWLPKELVPASLAYSEQRFIAAGPVSLGAIVDRVYRLPDQQLVLVEFKLRRRPVVYDSDIVELSVQRLALEGASREIVSADAYVVVLMPRRMQKVAYPVRLRTEDEIRDLIVRRRRVLNGTLSPQRARSLGLCKSCAFRVQCRAMQ